MFGVSGPRLATPPRALHVDTHVGLVVILGLSPHEVHGLLGHDDEGGVGVRHHGERELVGLGVHVLDRLHTGAVDDVPGLQMRLLPLSPPP